MRIISFRFAGGEALVVMGAEVEDGGDDIVEGLEEGITSYRPIYNVMWRQTVVNVDYRLKAVMGEEIGRGSRAKPDCRFDSMIAPLLITDTLRT